MYDCDMKKRRRMKRKRLNLNLTQKELAERVSSINDDIKITRQFITHIENGLRNPSLKTAKAIAKVLNSKIDDIF